MKYFQLLSSVLVSSVLVTSWLPAQATGLNTSNSTSRLQTIQLAANDATEVYNRGVDKYQKGDLQGALADFNEAIRLQDDFVSAYVNRANVKDDLGDPTAAIIDYNNALKYEKSDANIYYNRGLTYSRLKQYEKAVNDYDQSLALNPEYAPSYTGRAIIKHDVLDDKEGSLQDLKHAAELYQKQGDEAKAKSIMAIYEKIRGQ